MKPHARLLLLASLSLLVVPLSGCFGGGGGADEGDGGAEPSLAVSHQESSEMSRATIDEAPASTIRYADVQVLVDGDAFNFGPAAKYDARTYSVEGKKDAAASMRAGDVMMIPAGGQVDIEIRHGDDVLASYAADVPDEDAPAKPVPSEPANEATEVSGTPTFQWAAVSDPSGVQYRLQYSIESGLAAEALTTEVSDLDEPMYVVPDDEALQGGLTYYWRVQAIDGAGNEGAWSPIMEFEVALL